MEYINVLLGLDFTNSTYLTVPQIVLRTAIAFSVALILVRLGQIRFLKKSAAFDAIMYFMLGALMVDAITSNNNFYGILLGGLVIIFLHWLFAMITYYSSGLGYYFKGTKITLMENGEILWDEMRRSKVTQNDLESALRLKLNTDNFDKVKTAYLERNGDVSFIVRE